DGEVTLWSVEDGQRIAVLVGHRDEANAAAFSPDTSLVATAADDGTVRLWETTTGRPFWRAPIMLLDPPVLYSHQGWTPLDPAGVAEPPQSEQWRRVVELDVRRGDYHHGGRACIVTHGGGLELWSVHDGERLATAKHDTIVDVRAGEDGCLVRTEDGAMWLSEHGGLERLDAPGEVLAIGRFDDPSGTRALVATDSGVFDIGMATGARVVRPAEPSVTALARVGDALVFGYRDGNLRFFPDATSGDGPRSFENVPASAVERIVAGPADVVVAGFANGAVGMWSGASGARLALGRLHGRVAHLAVDGTFLYAASDLGHVLRWDLAVLMDDYCTVLREVWDRVPVVWADGRVMVQPAPLLHACAEL
ncbi:MAG: hypothetical protein JKY37_21685, partial [Nannocystaceae bacterium]|nr:hypothetical protein [Nannocystaceae bacterium]